MTRTASPSCTLPALLAVALLVFAAGPAAATVADALGGDCCHESCPPEAAAPGDVASCCSQAPADSHDAATPPASPARDGALVALVTDTAVPQATPRAHAPPRDTGPPAGPRRHLALSVFLV